MAAPLQKDFVVKKYGGSNYFSRMLKYAVG